VQRGPEQFQVGHHDEGADVEQPGPTPQQEAQQAAEPERAEDVPALCDQQSVHRPQPTDQHRRGHQRAGVGLEEPTAAQRERGQVDQSVPGRDEPGDGPDPVDVRLQQRGERVLDDRGEHHDQQGLHPNQRAAPVQQGDQHGPGARPQDHLADGFGRTGPAERDGVGHQDQADPTDHREGDRQFGVEPPPGRAQHHVPRFADPPGPARSGVSTRTGRHNDPVRISAKTDYALRAALELAVAPQDAWVKTETVAQRQGIPLPFLLNILAELRAGGLVLSRRGAEGGYRLSRSADTIRLADVIRVIDGPLANIAGERPEDVAYTGAADSLREVWVALRATMRTVLEGATLADVSAGNLPGALSGLLSDDDAWRSRA